MAPTNTAANTKILANSSSLPSWQQEEQDYHAGRAAVDCCHLCFEHCCFTEKAACGQVNSN